MSNIIYTKSTCVYCHLAIDLLSKLNIKYKEISIDNNPDKRKEMIAISNKTTVPQIFLNNIHIGGYDDLHDSYKLGKLKKILDS